MKRLTGKTAIVTGASQGLGEHLSVLLAREGANVVLAARNAERLDTIRDRIAGAGGTALAVPTDLSREEDCRKLIDRAVQTFGGIDVLVLNAGSITFGAITELTSFDPIRKAMEVNFYGAALPAYFAAGELVKSKGLIAYVTSGSGHFPMAGYLGYSTSKHAMNGFFECARLELAPHGVGVLTINPGDMHGDPGAGRTSIGPDGKETNVDLSIQRPNDIPRHPASEVAQQCLAAIVERRRALDLSPRIQKLGTVARTVAPGLVDRVIQRKVAKLRSAFEGEVAGLR